MIYYFLKLILMDYLNPNQTRKNANQTRTEIYKYQNGAGIFNPEKLKSE